METFLNAGVGIGILMFFLLLFKKEKRLGDYIFLVWILTMIGQVMFYWITINHFAIEGVWAIIIFALPLLSAPILFLYISWLVGKTITFKNALSHLSVYPIYIGLMLFLFPEFLDFTIAEDGYLKFKENSHFLTQYYAIPLAVSGFLYSIWDLGLLKQHRKSINQLFSYNEEINLRWVNHVVYSSLLLFIFASIWIFGATQFALLSIKNAFSLVGISLSLMLIAFGFYGFRQTEIFSNIKRTITTNENTSDERNERTLYSKSGLTLKKIQIIAERLKIHMLDKKPFLNEDLNVQMLSEQLEILPTHLSQVINQHYKVSFYDFINQYRVEQATIMLSSNDYTHLTILGIAFECGFKSKSSFNRYFKKYTGKAPSKFIS